VSEVGCGFVKYTLLRVYEEDRIYECCWWEMALNIGVVLSFDSVYDREGILKKARENSTKAYITNDGTSH
jgi:hypothetical protein